MIINRYGVHWAQGDIAFLVQGTGAVNLFSDELASPFTVSMSPRRIKCPHQIDLTAAVEPPTWADHPTAAYFMPVPRRAGVKPKLLHDPEGRYEAQILALTRLSSPLYPVVKPIWFLGSVRDIPYRTTNLGTLVWAGAEIQHTNDARRHITLAAGNNRHMVIVSRDRLPLFSQVVEPLDMDTLPDLTREPMEAIGAGALRKYMNAPQG